MSARSYSLTKRKQGNIEVISPHDDTANLLTIKLHGNPILVHTSGDTIVISACGWQTPTTKQALNRAFEQLGIDARVSQRAGRWYLVTDGNVQEFYDGMEVSL